LHIDSDVHCWQPDQWSLSFVKWHRQGCTQRCIALCSAVWILCMTLITHLFVTLIKRHLQPLNAFSMYFMHPKCIRRQGFGLNLAGEAFSSLLSSPFSAFLLLLNFSFLPQDSGVCCPRQVLCYTTEQLGHIELLTQSFCQVPTCCLRSCVSPSGTIWHRPRGSWDGKCRSGIALSLHQTFSATDSSGVKGRRTARLRPGWVMAPFDFMTVRNAHAWNHWLKAGFYCHNRSLWVWIYW